jgi:predicted DCC family thiol-disulfide oxidoreductase YuxK
VEARPPSGPVILFDGVCNLCNRFVQFVIARDLRAKFSFASLQSEAAARLGVRVGSCDGPESIVLLENGRAFTQSTAALRIVVALGFPWTVAGALLLVPRPLRDWTYAVIARNRYRWFGRRQVCMVPTPDLKGRFLE